VLTFKRLLDVGLTLAVSCPSASLCVAGDGAGNILSSTNPTGGPIAWSIAGVLSNESIGGVSCPSISLCVAVGGKDVLTATDPSGGASAGTKTTPDQGNYFGAVSCPSVSLCVAGDSNVASDSNGKILTTTNPTGGASAWTNARVARPDPNGNSLTGVSCPSVSLCIAADRNGNILTSTAPTGGANPWTSAAVDIPGCAPPSNPCISEQLYARDGQGTRVLDTAPPGHGNSIGNVALDGDSLISPGPTTAPSDNSSCAEPPAATPR
jgi:hypothetical protein